MNSIKLTLAQTRRFGSYVDGITWFRTQIKGLTTDLVVLPENWVGTRILSNGEFNEYVEMLKAIAEDINALVIGGAVYVNINGRNVSICPIVNERGGLINYSEKIYPSSNR